MLLILMPLLLLPWTLAETHHDEMLQCVCTTPTCQELAEPVCSTAGLCYSQFLDRKDGSDPVTKGCVNLKTPLLCENRPPKSSLRSRWPVLLCCRTHMCNQDDPRLNLTYSASVLTPGSDADGGQQDQQERHNAVLISINNPSNNNTLSNPTVLAVFCLGLAALLAIGITGCCVLTRQGTRQQMF